MNIDWFIHKSIAPNTEAYIKAKILIWFMIYALIISFLVESYNIIFDIPKAFPFFPLIIGLISLLLLFKYTGSHFLIGNTIIVICAFGLAKSTFETGGIYSHDMMISMCIPLVAYLTIGLRMGLLWVILNISFIFYMYYLTFDPAMEAHFRSQSVQLDNTFNLIGILLGFINICVFFSLFHYQYSSLVNKLLNNQQKLKQKNEELEQFTYIASHDLKTPLRTIISFAGLLERDLKKQSYENIGSRLSYIKSGAYQMYNLVQDILEYTKVEDKDRKRSKVVNLQEAAEKVVINMSKELQDKNAVVEIVHLPNYKGLESEFTILFQNLINNGLKYNQSENPIIKIWPELTKKTLQIKTKDNGIGIAPQYHQQIFQFFKRLHTKQEYNGTGLGLGLCKKILEHYKGKISVQSEVGHGSTFTIQLPINNSPVIF